MPLRYINVGSTGNDGTGDTLRAAFQKINENFQETYRQLVSTTTLYVSTTGSDSNSGLTDALPLRTIQEAVFRAAALAQKSSPAVVIQLADGTYSQTTITLPPYLHVGTSQPSITIKGNVAAPGNVVVNSTSGHLFVVARSAMWRLMSFETRVSDAVNAWATHVLVQTGAVAHVGGMRFGTNALPMNQVHLYVEHGYLGQMGQNTIVGSGWSHICAMEGSYVDLNTVPLKVGTPTFSTGGSEGAGAVIVARNSSYVRDWSATRWPLTVGRSFLASGLSHISCAGDTLHFGGNVVGGTYNSGSYE